MPEAQTVNVDQAALWNGAAGCAWVEARDVLDKMLAPFEKLLIEQGLHDDTRQALDIGCGAGATTLAAARRLGHGGKSVGVDISAALLEVAKQRATDARLDNASFICADAQTHAFEAKRFDAVISRFGMMFFDDPVAAFRNIRSGVASDASLTFVSWRSAAENPFMTTAARAAAPFLPDLPKPDPNAPGQFGLSDPDRVRQILEASGWKRIELRPIDVPASVGERDLKAYIAKMGPVGLALREVAEPTRTRTVAAVHAAFDPFVRDGEARFNAASWLVTARA
jgi:SAM-dependent methyltransferase